MRLPLVPALSLAALLATAVSSCAGARPVVAPTGSAPDGETGDTEAHRTEEPGTDRPDPDAHHGDTPGGEPSGPEAPPAEPAAPEPDGPRSRAELEHAEANLRDLVLASARNHVGATRLVLEGRDFGTDCSGYVRAVFVPLGVDPVDPRVAGSRTAMIHAWLQKRGAMLHDEPPAPGDLAFFHNTYDRNGDGQPNDEFTHVALVESVEPDGTINLLHRDTRRVGRFRMNLDRPGVARDGAEGPVLNSVLRRAGKGARHAPRLAGELFVAFGSPVRTLLAGTAAPLS